MTDWAQDKSWLYETNTDIIKETHFACMNKIIWVLLIGQARTKRNAIIMIFLYLLQFWNSFIKAKWKD